MNLGRSLQGLVLIAALGTGAAASARGRDCSFHSGGPLVLGFGTLDPSQVFLVQRRAAAPRAQDREVGDCAPGTRMQITVEGGLHDDRGQLRMQHVSRPNAYLRYAVQVYPVTQPGPGNGQYIGLELQGRLDPADIATAPGGPYRDMLRVSVTP